MNEDLEKAIHEAIARMARKYADIPEIDFMEALAETLAGELCGAEMRLNELKSED